MPKEELLYLEVGEESMNIKSVRLNANIVTSRGEILSVVGLVMESELTKNILGTQIAKRWKAWRRESPLPVHVTVLFLGNQVVSTCYAKKYLFVQFSCHLIEQSR